MRTVTLFATAVLLTACGPDPMIGSYSFTLTGTDTNTAPNNSTSTPSGTGTLAVTSALMTDYVLTAAQTDASPCVLKGTRGEKAQTITIAAEQKCTFVYAGGQVTATMTSGTATLKDNVMSLEVSYSYAGTTLGINYAGTGKRTYSGPRM